MPLPDLGAFDLLATAVVLVAGGRVIHLNPAAEDLLGISNRHCRGMVIADCLAPNPEFSAALDHVLATRVSITEHDLKLSVNGAETLVGCTVTPLDEAVDALVVEFHPIGRSSRIEREERVRHQTQASRELLRNLAHEIRNPLGGIRGAAQLLDAELGRPELAEYTRVIIQESDRLQSLLDRLLTPHRKLLVAPVDVHEVLERVRAVVLAETPTGIDIQRDYDVSLPVLSADAETLIQAVLNIVRNAVQAMRRRGEIVLRTRIARQVTIGLKRHPLAVQAEILDNGPGIPDEIRETIFFPLVSGREGGTGLGLTLAQTYVQQNGGAIEVESQPGHTCFRILLPVATSQGAALKMEFMP
jgi:two-component system nitrogen regulation sensor histidine kinase GlnL